MASSGIAEPSSDYEYSHAHRHNSDRQDRLDRRHSQSSSLVAATTMRDLAAALPSAAAATSTPATVTVSTQAFCRQVWYLKRH